MHLLEVRRGRRHDVVKEVFLLDEVRPERKDSRDFLRIAVPRGPVGIQFRRDRPPVDQGDESAPTVDFKRRLFDRGVVAAVAVHDHKAPGAVLEEAFKDMPHHVAHRFEPHVDRAGEVDVVRCDAKGDDGRHNEGRRRLHAAAEFFGDEPVGPERPDATVLLRGAHRDDDDAFGILQCFFGFLPAHFSEFHIHVFHSFERLKTLLAPRWCGFCSVLGQGRRGFQSARQ